MLALNSLFRLWCLISFQLSLNLLLALRIQRRSKIVRAQAPWMRHSLATYRRMVLSAFRKHLFRWSCPRPQRWGRQQFCEPSEQINVVIDINCIRYWILTCLYTNDRPWKRMFQNWYASSVMAWRSDVKHDGLPSSMVNEYSLRMHHLASVCWNEFHNIHFFFSQSTQFSKNSPNAPLSMVT